MKCLNFGSFNIDHVYRLPHLVRDGETLASTAYAKTEGGKGLNQSIALAKAGVPVYHAGAIGRDGLYLLDYVQGFGVNTRHVRVLDEPTGHAMIQVDDRGHNCIVLYGGANRLIDGPMIEQVLDDFEAGDFLLTQNEISGVELLLERAHARGMQVVFNPSPITERLPAYPLHCVDWFVLNEIEGCALTGCDVPQEILDVLLARYTGCRVVLTLGDKGAIYADAGRSIEHPARCVTAVDTTAAGDTFTGFLFGSLMRGDGIETALRQATDAAAIAVGRVGAGCSIPYLEELPDAAPVD